MNKLLKPAVPQVTAKAVVLIRLMVGGVFLVEGLLKFRNYSGVGQTSGLPVHGASGSVNRVRSKHRARGPLNWQARGLPHRTTF